MLTTGIPGIPSPTLEEPTCLVPQTPPWPECHLAGLPCDGGIEVSSLKLYISTSYPLFPNTGKGLDIQIQHVGRNVQYIKYIFVI